ncbi:unnamed protein product [Brassicogethes aeneus]|uniref:Uncharacterized protein n=1 Tax=Brassicogethes aeneus TaxID=1431903 RepID=A0A9P0FB95_BRAAE|nr:unnamed protein product [Brassicogethes aeneus]
MGGVRAVRHDGGGKACAEGGHEPPAEPDEPSVFSRCPNGSRFALSTSPVARSAERHWEALRRSVASTGGDDSAAADNAARAKKRRRPSGERSSLSSPAESASTEIPEPPPSVEMSPAPSATPLPPSAASVEPLPLTLPLPPQPPISHASSADDMEIKPGIAEMIREEERQMFGIKTLSLMFGLLVKGLKRGRNLCDFPLVIINDGKVDRNDRRCRPRLVRACSVDVDCVPDGDTDLA